MQGAVIFADGPLGFAVGVTDGTGHRGPTGPYGSWAASRLFHRIVRLSRRRRNAPRCLRIERELLDPAVEISDPARADLIGRYLRKRPDWPEGQAHLICDAL